jgi:hypothetical protein
MNCIRILFTADNTEIFKSKNTFSGEIEGIILNSTPERLKKIFPEKNFHLGVDEPDDGIHFGDDEVVGADERDFAWNQGIGSVVERSL